MTADELESAIRTINRDYAQALKVLKEERAKKLTMLQTECGKLGHLMKYHQCAGDGMYCNRCGFQTDEPY